MVSFCDSWVFFRVTGISSCLSMIFQITLIYRNYELSGNLSSENFWKIFQKLDSRDIFATNAFP